MYICLFVYSIELHRVLVGSGIESWPGRIVGGMKHLYTASFSSIHVLTNVRQNTPISGALRCRMRQLLRASWERRVGSWYLVVYTFLSLSLVGGSSAQHLCGKKTCSVYPELMKRMTPVYRNANDYYKKMLELQGRLRRSEDERIKLEKRFSVLERESRSRHETCINRLRMRYIEFLEEQQARDERNHKLLGALDRVDSSLALISAKTDRLGTMRRQYEAASLLKNWYVDRRANGSVGGDSGVASQNNKSHGGGETKYELIRKHDSFVSAVHPSITNIAHGDIVSAAKSRINYSPSKVERCFHKGEASIRTNVDTRDESQLFSNNRPESVSQSQLIHQTPRKYRFNNHPFNYGAYELTGRQSPFTSPKYSSLGYSRDVVQLPRATRRAALTSKDVLRKVHPIQNYTGFIEDGISSAAARSPSRFPKVVDISSQVLDDENEIYHVGDVVENELERYMNRIPRLYRDTHCLQSSEELDHEQNTSGDLLNVTLSDDGYEFPAEEKPTDDGTSTAKYISIPRESCWVPATRQTTSVRCKEADVYENISAGESGNSDEAREMGRTGEGRRFDETRNQRIQHGNKDFPIASGAVLRQSPSISSLSNPTDIYDNGLSANTRYLANNEKIALRAKNEISQDVAIESAARPSRNNENIAKSCENEEINTEAMGTRKMRSSKEQDDCESQGMFTRGNTETNDLLHGNDREFDGSVYKVVSGEERDAGNYFNDYAMNLEDWNLRDLERRVERSMIFKDGTKEEREISEPRSGDADGQLKKNEEKTEEYIAVENETGMSEVTNEGDISNESQPEYNHGTDQVTTEKFNEPNIAQETDYLANNIVDENIKYEVMGSEESYPNQENNDENLTLQYEYTVDGQYKGEPYHMQQYDEQNNVQYDEDPSGNQQYQYKVNDQQQHQGYNVGEEDQQYSADPGQGYSAADADLNYTLDSNERYVADGNQQYLGEAQQYPGGEAFIEEANEAYPAISAVGMTYPEDQEYAGLLENKDFASESEQSRGYGQEYEESVVPDDGQDYGDGYGTLVGPDHSQGYDQEHDTSVACVTQDNTQEARNRNELLAGSNMLDESNIPKKKEIPAKNTKDFIKSLLDSDTESTIERNVSNAESDFDFN